jgi:hypothetical protein
MESVKEFPNKNGRPIMYKSLQLHFFCLCFFLSLFCFLFVVVIIIFLCHINSQCFFNQSLQQTLHFLFNLFSFEYLEDRVELGLCFYLSIFVEYVSSLSSLVFHMVQIVNASLLMSVRNPTLVTWDLKLVQRLDFHMVLK